MRHSIFIKNTVVGYLSENLRIMLNNLLELLAQSLCRFSLILFVQTQMQCTRIRLTPYPEGGAYLKFVLYQRTMLRYQSEPFREIPGPVQNEDEKKIFLTEQESYCPN